MTTFQTVMAYFGVIALVIWVLLEIVGLIHWLERFQHRGGDDIDMVVQQLYLPRDPTRPDADYGAVNETRDRLGR
jgi:hypothetical protein